MGNLITTLDHHSGSSLTYRFALLVLSCAALLVSMVCAPLPALAANTHSFDFEDNNGERLYTADANQLDLSSAFTIETWAKLESIPSNGAQYTFVSKNQGSGNQRAYEFILYNNGGTKQLGLNLSTDGANGNFQYVTWTPSADTWYHLAATFNSGTGEVKVYVDGSQLGSTQTGAPTTTINNSSSNLYIASNPQSDDFDGKLDDVRIWNVVRAQSEIAADMGQELNGDENGLVGYWKLNNTLADETSYGATLTNDVGATASTDVPFTATTPVLKVRKSANETVTSSTALQNDNHLKLVLATSTTYIIDAVIFASSTSATPDLKIAVVAPSGSTMVLGYTGSPNAALLTSGTASGGISIPANDPTWVHLTGTVTTTGTPGDLQLKWAQNTSDAAGTTVMRGSYMRAEAI